MLVYENRGKQVELNSNEIESIDVNVKNVVGTPFVPNQYVANYSSPKIKINAVIEIEINDIIVDEYNKDIVIGYDILEEFETIKSMNENELFELTNNCFEKQEKDSLIDIIIKFRIK